MAHAFAKQLNVSPWDGLLMAVRIAAGKVAYCEWVLAQAKDDLELEGRVVRRYADNEGGPDILIHPDTGEPLGVGAFRDLHFWVAKSELWHDRLARTSKMAIDAGVAVWQVQQVEREAQNIARVLNAVIDGLESEITDAMALQMRAIMRRELMTIDAEQNRREITSENVDPDRAAVDSTGRWDGREEV